MKTLLKLRRRRAVERQATDWSARYTVDEHPELAWGQCRVIDVSLGGAGLELLGPATDEMVGRHVVLELEVAEQVARLHLRGTVRNANPTPGGGIRVGVEFDDLGDIERAILGSLLRRRTD